VATEVAARGLDIKELPHVVNYELPNVPEDYVHRIGRTARAGGSGCAVSLVSPDEAPLLKDIERLLKRALPVAATPDFPIRNVEARPAPPRQEAPAPRSSQHQQPRREHRSGGGHSGHGAPRQDSRGVVSRHGTQGSQDRSSRPGGGAGGRQRRRGASRSGKPARAY
jgi:ATP-dependent RNA helicase RhlE